MIVFDGKAHVHYGFLRLSTDGMVDPDEDHAARASHHNGVCITVQQECLAMVTGLHTGWVPFTVEWHERAPLVDDAWEDVVETPVRLSAAELVLGAFDWFQGVTFPQSGDHRARYCATGMDEGQEVDVVMGDEVPPDRYALHLWPAPPHPDEIVRIGSEAARYWHGVGS